MRVLRMKRPAALVVTAMFVVTACGGSNASAPAETSGGPAASGPAGTGGTGQIGGSINLWTAWGGQELTAFQAVLKPFQDQTGITVNVFTDRNTDQDLSTNVQAGTSLPDIAGAPNPDKYADWAQKGIMKAMEDYLTPDQMKGYLDNTLPGLLAQDQDHGFINGKHYLEIVKSQLKGMIWYSPKVFTGTPPATWDDLLKIQPPSGTKLFCAAFESGAASGWPASDDLDNILLRQVGPDVYKNWYQGKVKFTDPQIKQAYQTFGQMVSDANLYGGKDYALSTNFQKVGDGLFTTPPNCEFLEQATFIAGLFLQDNPDVKGGTDYNAFIHPKFNDQFGDDVINFFDNFVMYNDTPQARALMAYMITQPAQEIWVAQGGTLGANKNVGADKFTDPALNSAFKIAQTAKTAVLTAGDYMPTDMQKAFWKSLLDFTNDQTQLDSILQHLDEVQASAYQ
jgi:alpha-glucoside transport system substrate-binding protein